ncbi:hypothetical protein [Acidicapsa ligni]|uniref:hypothetical protein n=1 Tax=Acidicapsa ligni TaxID=542300 RepID=UPI0021E0414A|nr:hypothetical protein [Acidicapsa ligni]
MPYIPRVVSASVEYVPVLPARFARQVALCVLVTLLDAAVAASCGPTLFRVSVGHPVWQAGLTSLFAVMLLTLIHTWVHTLRRRSR